MQLLREINHENVVKLVNVHINHADMSLYLAFDYAEHDLYVSIQWAGRSLLLLPAWYPIYLIFNLFVCLFVITFSIDFTLFFSSLLYSVSAKPP